MPKSKKNALPPKAPSEEVVVPAPKRRGRPPKPPMPYDGPSFGLTKAEIVDVPLEQIDLADTTFELRLSLKPELLVDSIAKHGIQTPVVLREHPAKKGLRQIVCGFRRTTAAKMAGLTSVPAVVRKLTDEEAHILAYTENENRKTLSDLDRANGVAKLRQAGKTQEQVAQLFRLSDRHVRRLEQLLAYPDVIKRAVDDADSGVTTTHATVLMQAARKYGTKFEVARWVGQLRRFPRGVEQLRADVREQMEGGRRRKRALVRRVGDKIFLNVATIRQASDAVRRDSITRLREIIRELSR